MWDFCLYDPNNQRHPLICVRAFTTTATSLMLAVTLSPGVHKIGQEKAYKENCRENAKPVGNQLTRRSGGRTS